ncbi:hypothetical protein KSP40_PGU003619 [Platanthera guangdongensis]|uniref:Solute carrier family 40 member n=1 Tax=Platanthera guangdongensis TaxID=2320717 RepID=A0ABR2MVN5_9ASPA
MGLVNYSSQSPAPLLQRGGCLGSQRRERRRYSISVRRPRPSAYSVCRFVGFSSKCSVLDADISTISMEDETSKDLTSACSNNLSPLASDPFDATSFKLLKEDDCINYLLRKVQVLTKEEQDTLAATAAHPAGLYALYASFLVGNIVEQVWNFAWPAAVATLYPSLLPVAIVGFFSKLSIFLGAPLVGNLMDHFPRIPAYNSLNIIQTVAQLLSAAMIIHAHSRTPCTSASAVLLQPWFILLVVVGAIERLAGLALGVTVEREWVVLLAGTNRPSALACANAMLNRIDLLCEIAGASVFGILLTRFSTVTCLKLASGLMICALPVLVVENGLESLRNGLMEYINQPVLPASLAYVFLYFNIALAPGSIMTAFLMHHGVSPSVIGGFSGLSSFMGVAATFISATLVEKLGSSQAGAAGLVFQGVLLSAALSVLCVGSVSGQKPLFFFLSLIILSRLGHMSYDVVGTQILQTGIPISKANLIGTTEISIASLAEFMMLGVAIIANDVHHFSFLALLSFSSVVIAAFMFCCWVQNPSDEQRRLFSLDRQCQTCKIILFDD